MIEIDYYIDRFYIVNWGTLNIQTKNNVIDRIKEITPERVSFVSKGNELIVTGDDLPKRITCIARRYSVLLK